jgi:hypothetical protein
VPDPLPKGPGAIPKAEAPAYVDGMLANPSRELSVWLKAQNLTVEDALPNHPHVENQRRSFESRGLWPGADAWMKREAESLRSRTWNVTKYKNVAREICWRLVDARMRDAAPTILPPAEMMNSDDIEFLPKHLKWVLRHWGLFGEDDDPARLAMEKQYEEEFPPPGWEAINTFRYCRAVDKNGKRYGLEKTMEKISAIILAAKKKPEDETDLPKSREEQSIDSLEEELAFAAEETLKSS